MLCHPICSSLVEKLELPVYDLDELIYIGPIGGGPLAQRDYVEVNLKIPEVSNLDENVLMLVVDDSAYTERVPVALETIHIDKVLELITDAEIKQMGETWQRGKLARVLAAKATTMAKGAESFTLDQVNGDLKITKNLTLAPYAMGQCCCPY